MKFSTSGQLIKNVCGFIEILRYTIFDRICARSGTFYGWGRKRSGLEAVRLSKKNGGKFVLLEDGFIRSIGLGSQNSPSFSLIEDDVGIYYDATCPSRLENLLNSHEVSPKEIYLSREAIGFLIEHNISKYNHAPDISDDFFDQSERVLIISQTKNDASLKYGLCDEFSTLDMINAAKAENKNAQIYLKIHPEVLSGAKLSDISVDEIPPYCRIISEDVNPISLLKKIDIVYTKTSQMGFEALLLGKKCVCFGVPFYAGWGVSDDRVKCARRSRKRSVEEIFAISYILYAKYRDPYENKPLTLLQTLQKIAQIKRENLHKKAFFFGFSLWKHGFIKPFFEKEQFSKINFINPLFSKNYLKIARKSGLDKDSLIYIWGKKEFADVEEYASSNKIPLFRAEDGFIRSVKLGSDLSRPYSLVVDDIGIYFDATKESRLERILNTTVFDAELLKSAKNTRDFLVNEQISKYNSSKTFPINLPPNKKVIFAVGQVDDDASIRFGAPDMSSLKLLQKVRENAPDAFIIYKPHPDVTAKNRKGLSVKAAAPYCDKAIADISIDALFRVCDEVHTMTSLVGFEALLRGKKVVTYGMPFYAGWGLTCDTQKCPRRTRNLSVIELAAGVLLLYPRYIHPKTHKLCDIKTFLMQLQKEKINYTKSNNFLTKMVKFSVRKSQFIYRLIKR